MLPEPASEKRMIYLMSSDGETFEVEEAVAVQSQTLKHLIEDICVDSAIPLSNVKAEVLSKVIEYCKKHVESGYNEEDIQDWDKKFVEANEGMLFELILAANYLDITSLLELTCHTVANMIKGKSPKEIRVTFNVKNDFTPKDEEEIRRENRWVFE